MVLAAPVALRPAAARAADSTPPAVSIVLPTAGTLGGVEQIKILATDDTAVASASLLLDGGSIGNAAPPPNPYYVDWNTTTAASGPHTLIAEAYDGSGNRGADTVQVTVQNPAFVNEVVVPGITAGLTICFLPDGRMLVGDLMEKIWVVHPGSSSPQPAPFLSLNPSGLQGEQGLMEVILDPNFTTNHWYYVFYTHTTPNGNYDRVSRFTANGDTTIAGSEFVLWENDLNANLEHHGGGLAFGPGGKLFIAVGEAFYPDDAQRMDTYRGKLLRINPDGSIPPDNPFIDGAGPVKDEIYALGLRNPTRMFYDAPTGRLFFSDVGGNDANTAKEEINLAVAGANYGWPLCEGACGNPSWTDPLYFYPHSGRDAAVMCGFVYRGGTFPSEYQGSFFFGDYAQNWIKRLTFDGSGNLIGAVDFEPPDGAADGPYGDITKILQGPDGALYYADIGFNALHQPNDAAIRRIRYVTNDLPPVAVADATPRSGAPPLSVSFSSAGSYDPEGHPLTYSWDFGDNTSSTAANPTHVYANGMYTARLTVSDGVSSTLSSAILITVGTPPTVQILSPVDGSLFRAGDVIAYSGSAVDGSGNPLPASGYRWDIVFHHDSHVHPAGTVTGVTSGTFDIPISGHDFSGSTNYEFSLTATDSNGLQSSTSVQIYPDKVNLPFSTRPAGLSLDVDGLRKVTPFVLDALKGFHYTIGAPAQSAGGLSYAFTSWSDGGAQSHGIVVPDHDSSWVATFVAQSQIAGLVAAYPFEEGTGSTTADRSGNGNTGTLSGAAWTAQGRYGGGMAFNGTSAMVTVPDSPSLALTSAMTLEAWVDPTFATGAWTDVVMKQGDDYYLAATAQPTGTSAMGASLAQPVYAPAPPPLNTWTHLAATYDGAAMRLYVNGVQVNSRAVTGTLATSGGPLSFGGDALFGQHFTGVIDEVRVYNRALSPSEIQQDMAFPIVTGVEAAEPSPPRSSAFLCAAPNPFNPSTSIRFRLASAAGAALRIFDVSGRFLRAFDLRRFGPGEHAVVWDGTSSGGSRLGSGVYLARLDAADGAQTMRIVLVR